MNRLTVETNLEKKRFKDSSIKMVIKYLQSKNFLPVGCQSFVLGLRLQPCIDEFKNAERIALSS